ncbi:MAG TPA: ATP-binding protein, partial [candidate division Zixibacteria bacterium]|nr:ATP-binding protein [candidate division Zixibacteria bacterium]
SGQVARSKLQASERFRIFPSKKERVLGTITPIENEPACSNSACHAHPANQRILGILDTEMSLARADASLAETSRTFALLTLLGIALTTFLIWYAVRVVVHKPLSQLRAGTDRLASGELGFHLEIDSENDEVGLLAASFNTMSDQLLDARREITSWTRTLEQRVEQKTGELRRAHDQMLKVERMVSIGKLAAVVAHEINNPLAGILTYAKLLRKWISNGITTEEKKTEAVECLDLIAIESKRCGELVKNLLTFSRVSPMNLEKTSINAIIERCVKLVAHKAEAQSIFVVCDVAVDLPAVLCDGAQVEQVLLALIMNALDAMPRGGNLWVSSRILGSEVELQVRDDGTGIPPELMNKIFEPFTTTKEVGKGVGLGLAVAKGVVERHGGRIEVDSELGVGTTFRVFLPLQAHLTESAAATAGAGQW